MSTTGNVICWEFHETLWPWTRCHWASAEPASRLWIKHSNIKKTLSCCKGRWCSWPVSSWTQMVTVSQSQRDPVYLPNQLVEERRNERPVWHQPFSLYNFRPHFPPRPLNLTAIWWFAAITIHDWVKINLWDASSGQGFEDALSTTCAWLCAGYDNLLWFILSADDSPHIICNRTTVRVYNIIQLKFEGEAKIESQPHQEAETRNSLFDGYIFQWYNDGVFKTSPPIYDLG